MAKRKQNPTPKTEQPSGDKSGGKPSDGPGREGRGRPKGSKDKEPRQLRWGDRATGRRSELSPELERKIVKLIRNGNYADTAAAIAGVPHATLFDWFKRGRDGQEPYRRFLDQIKKAESYAQSEALERIRSHGRRTWQANAWFLERRFPKRWGAHRLKPPEDTQAPPPSVRELSDAQLETLMRVNDLLASGVDPATLLEALGKLPKPESQ